MKENKNNTTKGNYIETNNSMLYYQLRNAFATNDFDESLRADLSQKKLKAFAEIKPSIDMSEDELIVWKNSMAQNLMSMDDLTADVLDIITYIWLNKANNPNDTVMVSDNDFLKLRGLSENLSGDGRRGGFSSKQKDKISNQILILDNTWIKIHEIELTEMIEAGKKTKYKKTKWQGETKAVHVTYRFGKVDEEGKMDAHIWSVRPGEVFSNFLFGPGRQTALLSQKALEYDPYRQKIEKRLARHFAWKWGNEKENKFIVNELLSACKEELYTRMPARTKDRFEKALEQLQEDNVICSWYYESFDESQISRKGWCDIWLDSYVVVTPPENLEIEMITSNSNYIIPKSTAEFNYENIRKKRKMLNLTLAKASEQIGISASRLSRIEKGENTKDETTLKILAWLEIN